MGWIGDRDIEDLENHLKSYEFAFLRLEAESDFSFRVHHEGDFNAPFSSLEKHWELPLGNQSVSLNFLRDSEGDFAIPLTITVRAFATFRKNDRWYVRRDVIFQGSPRTEAEVIELHLVRGLELVGTWTPNSVEEFGEGAGSSDER